LELIVMSYYTKDQDGIARVSVAHCNAHPSQQFRKTPLPMTMQKTGRKVKDEQGVDTAEDERALRYVTVGVGDAQRIQTYGRVWDAAKASREVNVAEGKQSREAADSAEEILTGSFAMKGEWGLGCPHCPDHPEYPGAWTAFWFRVNDEGTGYVPRDDSDWKPTSLAVIETLSAEDDPEGVARYLVETRPGVLEWVTEVPVTYGHLNWRPQPDGSVLFTCPRCGGEVRLEP